MKILCFAVSLLLGIFSSGCKDLGPAPPVSKEEGEAERFPTGFTQENQIY